MFRQLLAVNLLRSIYHHQSRTMKVVVDKVLSDNYMYYLIDTHTREALVVDLGDASRVSEIEKREKIEIKGGIKAKLLTISCLGALITHHHLDHSAGTADFLKDFPNAKIYGADKERIPDLTDVISDGQTIKFNGLSVECIASPGYVRMRS